MVKEKLLIPSLPGCLESLNLRERGNKAREEQNSITSRVNENTQPSEVSRLWLKVAVTHAFKGLSVKE
jgi:hypothetical protein